MAEILLKIHPGAGYEDGDILCAFNHRRTRQCHAESICHPWKNGIGKSGLRPSNGPAEAMLAAVSQYRFDRVSQYEVLRTDLITGEQELFSKTPNKRGEAIDVEQWVARRLREKAPDGGPRASVFGEPGRERWYGGRTDTSDAVLDKVWQKIAEKTGRLESEEEFQLWPMGRLDIRHHLAVRTTDFTDEESEKLVQQWAASDVNGDPIWELVRTNEFQERYDANKLYPIGAELVDKEPLGLGEFRELPEEEWYWRWFDCTVQEECAAAEQPGPEWRQKQLSKRRINCDWRAELLDELKVTEADVLDRDKLVGADVVFPIQRLQHRSKEQPEQSKRDKLRDKLTGGKVQ